MIFQKRFKKIEEDLASLKELIVDKRKPSMSDLMRESLGIFIDFSVADEQGSPPHYLAGLGEDERRNFIINAEAVVQNSSFQEVMRYMINIYGFHALLKDDKDQMKYGQISSVSIATFRKQFDDMHKEFLLLNQKDESFDPLAVLPE